MNTEQLELVGDLLHIGDRVLELPGTPSQRCGTLVGFACCNASEIRYPVVLWDSGVRSFSSADLGLTRLADVQQLSFF